MAFLHTHSHEGAKSELDFFTLPPTQTSIEGSSWIEYKPVTSLTDDAPIEFVIPGHGDEYLDLARTLIYLKVQVVDGKGKNLSNEALVSPVNNFLHSMFNQIDVSLNQKAVSPSSSGYNYRAYIETLLNYGSDAKKSHLTSALWYPDEANYMDDELKVGEANGKKYVSSLNSGARERMMFIAESKTLDLLGHLHCDIFNQEQLIPNGVEVRVRLVRAKDKFCLLDFGNGDSKVKIKEVALRVHRCKISPSVLLAHASALSKGTAKYPLTRVEIKSFTLHTGVTGECLDNVILGQLPKRIILGLVENQAFNGHPKKNPFNFHHHNLNFLSLYIDGTQVPSKPVQPEYPNTYIEAYHTLFSGTGIHFSNEGNSISRSAYPFGYCLYAFDLSQDHSAHNNNHWNLIKQGSVRIELKFSEALTTSLNCILYAEYDNVMEIDSSRQVLIDYST